LQNRAATQSRWLLLLLLLLLPQSDTQRKTQRASPRPARPSPQQRSIGIHSLLLQTRFRTGRGEAASTTHGQLLNRCLVSWQTRKVAREGRLTGLQMRASCRRTNKPQMAEVRGQRRQRGQRGHQRTPEDTRPREDTAMHEKTE
jgi:hypothetical protein